MTQTATDVCNFALLLISGGRIGDIEQDTKEARLCKASFAPVRRALLRSYHWNFAMKRAALAPDSTDPAWGYEYAYSLPADCVRPLMDPAVDWPSEGGKILTNTGPVLKIRYISDVEDPALWDPSFYTLMGIDMATTIVRSLAGSAAMMQELALRRRDALSDAKRSNSWERRNDDEPLPPILAVRL